MARRGKLRYTESMNFRMDKLIIVFGEALDIVEGEILGSSTHHGKRIAVLCAAMGRKMGMGKDRLITLVCCALLHDNALTEYVMAEQRGAFRDPAMKLHCEYGQRNIGSLEFPGDIRDLILYHHERADGSGPYGKTDYPFDAELIGIADEVDVNWHLQRRSPEEIPEIAEYIRRSCRFFPETQSLFMSVLDGDMLLSLRDGEISKTVEKLIPPWEMDNANPRLPEITAFMGRVIDYKSVFTQIHSSGIVEKALIMADYYGRGTSERNLLSLAANLHDIGKLAVPTEILEKPGKLSPEEFQEIAAHARKTAELLAGLESCPGGLNEVRIWASNHHEKLDGSGYPLGKTGAELDFNSRLLACLDIYQAVREERPYHPARDHGSAMEILRGMADKGAIDGGIAGDIGRALAP
ncbi:MAG: HD domain-containing protein [Treponema sp.]|jgi:HD-GYP domain-containing protein (c-di-GMP phosphodiesterase class II)|nr:HD domain-containing protein [Treponema sp.]